MNFNIIVATCANNGIGKDNQLPWDKISEDMKNFSKLTKGRGNNAIIMGKNTYKSIGRPLPGRANIVLSNTLDEEREEKNIYVLKNIDECIKFCTNNKFDEVWVIGGESIYRQFLDQDLIHKIYKTDISENLECDTFFPNIPNSFHLNMTKVLKPNVSLTIWINKSCPFTNSPLL